MRTRSQFVTWLESRRSAGVHCSWFWCLRSRERTQPPAEPQSTPRIAHQFTHQGRLVPGNIVISLMQVRTSRIRVKCIWVERDSTVLNLIFGSHPVRCFIFELSSHHSGQV